jgi:hypothetical protein
MIVSMALAKIFENFTINVNNENVLVNFYFGDQKEYNKWITNKMKSNSQKYPLIWYVLAPNNRNKNSTIDIDSQLILFMGTKQNYNNVERYYHNYKTYLEPLQVAINNLLEINQNIVLYENPINNYDEPNFGSGNNIEFTTENKVNNPKDVSIDIVDARILKIKLNINTECILNNN